jgi:hypothetical protein
MPVCDQFKQDFKRYLIQDLYQNFDVLSGDTLFLGIGKPTEWTSITGANRDTTPPQSIDSIKNDTDFWRYAMAFKKIQKNDVSLVVPRYDWEPNVIYNSYRDDIDLYDDKEPLKFYVLVDEERVYKCIDNNYDSVSTVAPTHVDYQIRTLSDGYRWKYLYSISESKRKFLTPSRGKNIGYMPVEYVERVNQNDDRQAQYDVQNAAVAGSIDFIHLDETLRDYVISDKVLFFNTANQIVSDAFQGFTEIVVGGSLLVYENDYYNNMSIKIESGAGSGQQRKIVDFISNGNNTATVVLNTPLDYGISGGANPSYYSIFPTVIIEGDGDAYESPLHTSATGAEITVTFLSTSATGNTSDCACENNQERRYLDRFELINSGQNYSYADVKIVNGLTFASGIVDGDLNLLAKAIMSPVGGHGVDAVYELGASSLMIVVDLEQSEGCKISTENDYRQFALIKNPLLKVPHTRLNLSGAGLSGSFAAGDVVTQETVGASGSTGYDYVRATVFNWIPGTTGTSGTSELTVINLTGGEFALGGLINGVTSQQIVRIREKLVAGTEYRLLKRLKLAIY